MKMEEINVRDSVTDVQILAERISVLAEDLTQEYFCKQATNEDELKEIAWMYYDRSGVKMEMIFLMALDVENKLKILQETLKNSLAS